MRCAASASTAKATTPMPSSSATCATWPCTRSATVCPTSPRDSGSVAAAFNRPQPKSSASCAPIGTEPSSRPTRACGHTSFAPFGYLRSTLLTRCSSNPLSASRTSTGLAGSSCAIFVASEMWVRVFSVISSIATRPFMSRVPNRQAST